MIRDLWTKRVASARETVAKERVQIVAVKDYAPFVRKMGPMYTQYLADPAVRAELHTIIRHHTTK